MRISCTDYRTSLSSSAEAVGHRECAPLVGFQGDFLRKHDVARGQIAVWQKTPSQIGLPERSSCVTFIWRARWMR